MSDYSLLNTVKNYNKSKNAIVFYCRNQLTINDIYHKWGRKYFSFEENCFFTKVFFNVRHFLCAGLHVMTTVHIYAENVMKRQPGASLSLVALAMTSTASFSKRWLLLTSSKTCLVSIACRNYTANFRCLQSRLPMQNSEPRLQDAESLFNENTCSVLRHMIWHHEKGSQTISAIT